MPPPVGLLRTARETTLALPAESCARTVIVLSPRANATLELKLPPEVVTVSPFTVRSTVWASVTVPLTPMLDAVVTRLSGGVFTASAGGCESRG